MSLRLAWGHSETPHPGAVLSPFTSQVLGREVGVGAGIGLPSDLTDQHGGNDVRGSPSTWYPSTIGLDLSNRWKLGSPPVCLKQDWKQVCPALSG